MANPIPVEVRIRTYQVGFGDCFLMSIAYDQGAERHVLIDFGSTEMPEGKVKSKHMLAVATDIQQRCGADGLTAVVATHRHQDHISGFARNSKGKGSGKIIADLNPRLVCQPWTEHPDIPTDATVAMPKGTGNAAMGALARSLTSMQRVSAAFVEESKENAAYLRMLGEGALRRQLMFIGEDNISNKAAVSNLLTMAKASEGEYLHAGKKTRLSELLDCNVMVLGPPTVKQHASVKKQRSTHAGEYWHLAAHSMIERDLNGGERQPLFSEYIRPRVNDAFPAEARWLISRAKRLRGEQMLSIVRTLDTAMNNTSLILLFRIGSKSFLFPGDAQWENWEYALSKPSWVKLLSGVDVYKVGHHGSLNATPMTLWKKFSKKSQAPGPGRMKSLMSTLEGKHGHAIDKTEVPRETLVTDLKAHTDYFTTQQLEDHELCHETIVDVR